MSEQSKAVKLLDKWDEMTEPFLQVEPSIALEHADLIAHELRRLDAENAALKDEVAHKNRLIGMIDTHCLEAGVVPLDTYAMVRSLIAERDALRARLAQGEPVNYPPLKTSQQGRDTVAGFFINKLNRADFTDYIHNTLAADFACVLGGYLSSAYTAQQQAPALRDAMFFIGKDGNEFYAVRDDFINLQESDAAFGKTPVDALCALLNLTPSQQAPSGEELQKLLNSAYAKGRDDANAARDLMAQQAPATSRLEAAKAIAETPEFKQKLSEAVAAMPQSQLPNGAYAGAPEDQREAFVLSAAVKESK